VAQKNLTKSLEANSLQEITRLLNEFRSKIPDGNMIGYQIYQTEESSEEIDTLSLEDNSRHKVTHHFYSYFMLIDYIEEEKNHNLLG
jgi:hypothetical protein